MHNLKWLKKVFEKTKKKNVHTPLGGGFVKFAPPIARETNLYFVSN